jgi:hypothetical protein
VGGMTTTLETQTIAERFDHILALIKSERFLKKQGLGNEVPFFIVPFPVEESVQWNDLGKKLIKQLGQNGVLVLKVNLYDLCIELLKERGIWDKILEVEESTTKADLKELLQGVVDSREYLVPAIAKKMREDGNFDVLFLTGVGEVFPYIRSHNVLNNLQSTAQDKPTVIFFPGAYTHSLESGASLDLFGCLHDDKYYRAFNIFHCEV